MVIKEECLLSITGKMCCKVLIEKVQTVMMKDHISEDQDGFRTGLSCIDQTFNFRMVIIKMLAKKKKMFPTFIVLRRHMKRQSGKECGMCWRYVYEVSENLFNSLSILLR